MQILSPAVLVRLFATGLVVLTSLPAPADITELITHEEAATPSTVMANGVSVEWGVGNDLMLDGFVADGETFSRIRSPDRVRLVRRDIPSVATGNLCGVFVEQQPGNSARLNASFIPQVGNPSACDMAGLLESAVINRGTLDTFTNTGSRPNNIERVDILFDGGLPTSDDTTDRLQAGHAVGEKNGNNRVQVAAVTALDVNGNPAAYGPLIMIGRTGECPGRFAVCYSQSSFLHDYVFFKSLPDSPQFGAVRDATSREPVSFAFLSLEELGVPAGSVYYGVSIFPPDVSESQHDLLDVRTFPADTQEPEVSPDDSADIYGGLAYYEALTGSGASGTLSCRVDGAGGSETRPVIGQGIYLYRDADGDGAFSASIDEQIIRLPGTGEDGGYSFSALADGSYFLVLVEAAAIAEPVGTFVIVQGTRADRLDIVLGTCPSTAGPVASDDAVSLTTVPFTVSIPVLANDASSQGVLDAAGLQLVVVSDSITATIVIDGRNIIYTPTDAFIDTAQPGSPAVETFSYAIEDTHGERASALVTVTIQPAADPPPECATDPIPAACLFVETEVDGVGYLSPLTLLLLGLFFCQQPRGCCRRFGTEGGSVS